MKAELNWKWTDPQAYRKSLIGEMKCTEHSVSSRGPVNFQNFPKKSQAEIMSYTFNLLHCYEDVVKFQEAVEAKQPGRVIADFQKLMYEEAHELTTAKDDVGFADGVIDFVYVTLGRWWFVNSKAKVAQPADYLYKVMPQQMDLAMSSLFRSFSTMPEMSMYELACLIAYSGLPFTQLWNLVHSRNMDKIERGTVVNGKLIKPADFVPPNINSVLTRHPILR